MRQTLLLALSVLAAAPLARAQVSLENLPELARERAKRLRPKQLAALEPFLTDFTLEYRSNQRFLDGRIEEAARLGDSVIPILLEKLQPAQSGSSARNLADNCRRVLQRLDPSSFVDPLAEMARGDHAVARHEAIILLGFAEVPLAGRVLTELVDQLGDDDRRWAIRSLRLLEDPSAATKVGKYLASRDRGLREDVLAYLIAAEADAAVDVALEALAVEEDHRLLPSYIDYFASCVEGSEAVATALLPLLQGDRLDYQDRRSLVRALATIAPEEHEPTLRSLNALIEDNETSSLAVQAAVTMRELGEKQGITRLKRSLDDKLRKRRRDAVLYEQRASLLFAIEDYDDAIDDYEKILEFTEGAAMTRRAYQGLLLCEARRRKIKSLVRYMKASGMSPLQFQLLAEQDEPFAEAMEHDRVRSFLKDLIKERAPK